jgi:hypothetical protein
MSPSGRTLNALPLKSWTVNVEPVDEAGTAAGVVEPALVEVAVTGLPAGADAAPPVVWTELATVCVVVTVVVSVTVRVAPQPPSATASPTTAAIARHERSGTRGLD